MAKQYFTPFRQKVADLMGDGLTKSVDIAEVLQASETLVSKAMDFVDEHHDRPRRGDRWKIEIPGKPTRIKEIGRVNLYFIGWRSRRSWYVEWNRLPKGRYSGISLKGLLKYGSRVDTKQERQVANRNRMELERLAIQLGSLDKRLVKLERRAQGSSGGHNDGPFSRERGLTKLGLIGHRSIH